MGIEELRKKIDRCDDNILKLLNERASFAGRIGEIKRRSGSDFYVPHREKKILAAISRKNRGPLSGDAVKSVFVNILSACRSLESRIKVAYFGPEASFTHLAAKKNFGLGAEYIPAKSIGDVFSEVEKGRADYGVVPIENSTEGMVNHTLDMFIESDLLISSELSMPIEHCLLSVSGDIKKITKLYTFSQPLVQCRNWVEENLRDVRIIDAASTSDAARKAAKDPHGAAIASSAAAELYNLEIVQKGIEDSRENHTRFLIIGKKSSERSGQDKTSILFSIKDKVGALYEMLTAFKKHGINLTKIESRPTKKKAWEYIFFIDFMGHIEDARVRKALDELSGNCVFLKVLGSYPVAE